MLDHPRDPTALACVREEPKTLRNSAELDLRTVADKERAARITISVAQAQADIDPTRLREKAVRRVKGWLTWQQPPQIDEGSVRFPVDRKALARLTALRGPGDALRGPGEGYSDVILRLAKA